MNLRRTGLAAAAAFALAACAAKDATPTRWQQPDTDEARALADERDCRRLAQAEVERDSRRDRIFGDDGLARPGSFDSMMARHEARSRIEKLIADCMRRRGYAPAPPAK